MIEEDKNIIVEMHGEEKVAGNIVEITRKTYITRRTDKTFFRMWRAFLISIDILEELKKRNIQDVIIEYQGREYFMIYRTTLKKFLDSEKEYNYKESDVQKGVCIDDMEILEKKELKGGLVK